MNYSMGESCRDQRLEPLPLQEGLGFNTATRNVAVNRTGFFGG